MIYRLRPAFAFLLLLCAAAGSAQTTGTGAGGQAVSGAAQNYRTGRDLEARNRMADADRYYNEAVRICQDEVARNAAGRETYAVITWALQRQKKYADVITWGERGLRLFSDEYRILETMGEAYFYLDDYDRSLSFMQRYVNFLPRGERVSVAYFFIGEIFRLRQRYRHADIAYTTAVRLEPGLPLWWYRLATVREVLGDTNPAIEAYERALALNPAYQEASAGLARIRAR
ncbi:MAG: tetratricopeptide repeat protein [Treponema sp.]|jgi:tetratricopeptide (TPR) repeat protein|nr:tetratricopeptide repeat protein [Treponema sp.]